MSENNGTITYKILKISGKENNDLNEGSITILTYNHNLNEG